MQQKDSDAIVVYVVLEQENGQVCNEIQTSDGTTGWFLSPKYRAVIEREKVKLLWMDS